MSLTIENKFQTVRNFESVLTSIVNTKGTEYRPSPRLAHHARESRFSSPSVANHNFFEKASEVCGEVRDENDFRISNRRRTNAKKECGEKSLRVCNVDVSRRRREWLRNSSLLGE